MMRSLLFVAIYCAIWSQLYGQGNEKITGMTMVAPPNVFTSDPMPAMKNVNASWVALVPYAFIPRNSANVRFESTNQWWGERKEGVIESIKLAKKNDMKILLKPQVWMHGNWVGDMDHASEKDWQTWEKDYRAYIMSYVDLAQEYDIEMICVGTEFKIASVKREQFWRELISDIRLRYDGLLTYSSNWDSYKDIPFWDDLDIIGISAYFPLTEATTPNVFYLKYKWNPVKRRLKRFSEKQGKPILFTEYGYLSVDGCAYNTWELEKKRRELNINEQAQSNALEALYSSFWNEKWWSGGFLWKWYPYEMNRRGRREKDYTPQGKLSEETIRKWYGKSIAE